MAIKLKAQRYAVKVDAVKHVVSNINELEATKPDTQLGGLPMCRLADRIGNAPAVVSEAVKEADRVKESMAALRAERKAQQAADPIGYAKTELLAWVAKNPANKAALASLMAELEPKAATA